MTARDQRQNGPGQAASVPRETGQPRLYRHPARQMVAGGPPMADPRPTTWPATVAAGSSAAWAKPSAPPSAQQRVICCGPTATRRLGEPSPPATPRLRAATACAAPRPASASPTPGPPAARRPGILIAARDDAAPFGIELDTVAETMADVAAADRNSLGAEMDDAGCRGRRTLRRLHLFYDIDCHSPSTGSGRRSCRICSKLRRAAIGRRGLLRSPGREPHRLRHQPSKPIHNLDLGCWSRCGDLFLLRLIQPRHGRPQLGMDDSRRPYIFTDMPYKCWPAWCSRASDTGHTTLLNHQEKPGFTNSDRCLGGWMAHQISNVMRWARCSLRCGVSPNRWPPRWSRPIRGQGPLTPAAARAETPAVDAPGRALRLPIEGMEKPALASAPPRRWANRHPDAVLRKPGPAHQRRVPSSRCTSVPTRSCVTWTRLNALAGPATTRKNSTAPAAPRPARLRHPAAGPDHRRGRHPRRQHRSSRLRAGTHEAVRRYAGSAAASSTRNSSTSSQPVRRRPGHAAEDGHPTGERRSPMSAPRR